MDNTVAEREMFDANDAEFDPEWEVMLSNSTYVPRIERGTDGCWEFISDGICAKFKLEDDAEEFADALATLESRPTRLDWTFNRDWPDHPRLEFLSYRVRMVPLDSRRWIAHIGHRQEMESSIGYVSGDSAEEVKSEVERMLSALMLVGLSRLGRAA